MANKVPSVSDLEQIDEVLSAYLNKTDNLALFLDYDGTLAPLASHPSLTVMEPESEAALKELATMPNIHLAIISGRGAENARAKVNIDNITYAGNHGLEIIFWDKSRYHYEVGDEVRENFTRMVIELEEQLCKDGAWVENKEHSLTFHYREVPEKEQESYKLRAAKIIQAHGYIPNQAHCAIEAKPAVEWNKGQAALHILQREFGENWPNVVKVVFAGDDTTDEDAMRALKGKGLSFRVSVNPDIETNADYRVPSTAMVAQIMQWILSTMSQANNV